MEEVSKKEMMKLENQMCVPLYAADKALPSFDFYTAYFTVESKEECEEIFRMIEEHEIPEFRHTSGLYKRELL